MFNRLLTRVRSRKKSVIFYRDFTSYSGGHQKVADYFNHLQSSDFAPFIAFSPTSRWDEQNPWFPAYQHQTVAFTPAKYTYAFLAGMDWQAYLAASPPENQPVVNLIQHVRHADPSQNVYPFLTQHAIRICVSAEVEDALRASGRVHGPIFTIANGHHLPEVAPVPKRWDVCILGPKNPGMAQELDEALRNTSLRVLCLTDWVSRSELLAKMAASRIAVLLPHVTEGFYLPALEAMHYCDLTLVPDCIGNRGFCHHQKNCLMPDYNLSALYNSVIEGVALLERPERREAIRAHARETLEGHSLERERQEFLTLMAQVDDLWRS